MAENISERIIDHLDEALEAEQANEKDFHIRQAEQLAVRLEDSDD